MERISMDRGWLFFSDPDSISLFGSTGKGGQEVNLPHDAMIGREVSPNASNGRNTGFYEGSAVLYQKELDFTQIQEGSRYVLEFDGAYMNAEVSLNGRLLGSHHNGYFPFHVDLTPYLHYGEKNSVSVFVNNSAQKTERWYTGTGLYRHVDLLTAPKVHLSPWPIYARTDHVVSGDASVWVEVTAENHTEKDCVRRVDILLKDEDGNGEAAGSTVLCIPAMGRASGRAQILVKKARLWDIDSPELYRIEAILREEDKIPGDRAEILFGIRTISMD
ncbi:MAG: glycoside hydrolase family 2 protein, partial [Acetatifactor sp.]|nr:glycoside hydrolase family 2 protein [Acetatifactor sp.]